MSNPFAPLEARYGLPTGVLDALWAQESGRGQNMLNQTSGAAGHFQLIPQNYKAAGLDPNDLEASAEWAADYAAKAIKRFPDLDPVEAIAAHHYGGPDTKQWGPKTRKYVEDIRRRMGSSPGGGYTIPASAITGDPSAYSGGGIMPVSAQIPQSTLMPDQAPQTPQKRGVFGIDPELGGLIGLSMLAGSFGGQQGGMGGALSSAIPLLATARKKDTADLKSRREIQYLVSLGYSPQDAALMVHTGQKPTDANAAPTLAERKFEFDRFKYLNPKAPKPTADEVLGAKLAPDGTLEEQVEAARTLGRANPAEAADLKQEAARQKATAKRAEKGKAYESALADVDRLMELALGKTNPKTGEVTPGAFTGVDSGGFDRAVAGVGNLLDRINRPKAETGEGAPRRSYMYQDEMNRLLAGFSTVFGEKGTQSDKDIMRQLAAMPQGDWYPDTENDARMKLQALRDTIERKRQIALSEGAGAGGYADPGKERRYQEYLRNKGATP